MMHAQKNIKWYYFFFLPHLVILSCKREYNSEANPLQTYYYTLRGFQEVEAPTFQNNGHMMVTKVVSHMHWP
jgi:hypothetical protein